MTDAYCKAFALIEDNEEKDYGPNGGFTAILSTPSEDRDGDQLFREEWKEFTQERYPLDMDHGMSVAETIGSFRPYFEGQKMMMEANFAGDPESQRVRGLVTPDPVTGIRHIQSVSVAFLVDKTKKSGEPKRELLNAGVVAVPSNRDAVILASKAASALKDAFSDATEGEVPEEVKKAVLDVLGAKDVADAEAKDSPKPYGDVHYADPEDGKYPVAHIRAALAYINMPKNYAALGDHAAHVKRAIEEAARAHGIDVADKSVEGETKAKKSAVYIDVIPRLDQEALKNVVAEVLKAATPGAGGDHALVSAIHDASVHLGAQCIVQEPDVDPGSGADDGANKSAEGADTKDLDAFEKALDEVLPSDDSPAEAAAATDEVPAPAEAADEKTKRARGASLMHMIAQLPK